MVSDEKDGKDKSDLELEDTSSAEPTVEDDIVDLEVEGLTPFDDQEKLVESPDPEVNQPSSESPNEDPLSPAGDLSADPFAGEESFDDDDENVFDQAFDVDVDITGDEEIDFADEEGFEDEGGSKLKKMMLPALLLVMALGAGGFIIMNPEIVGGKSKGSIPEPAKPYVADASFQPTDASDQASTPPQELASFEQKMPKQQMDITESDGSDSLFAESLPQPTVNQNEVPRGPAGALVELGEDTMPPAIPNSSDITETIDDIAQDNAFDLSAAEPVSKVQPDDVVDPFIEVTEKVDSSFSPEQEANALESDLLELQAEASDAVNTIVAPEAPKPMDIETSADSIESVQTEDFMETKPDSNEIAAMKEKEEPAAFKEVKANEEASQGFTVAEAKVEQVNEAFPPAMETNQAPSDTTLPEVGTAQAPVKPSANIAPAADSYYDGMIPTGPLAREVGPRKLDPVVEPASQFVVVKKAHEKQDIESLIVSANRALQLKRYDSALEMFDSLYSRNSRDQRILMGRAIAQQNAGLPDSALRSYEEILDINPKNTNAMLNMLGILKNQYPSVALRRLMDLHDRYPNHAGITAQIGVTQADLGHTENALRYLGMAASIEPKNALHVFNMAIIADRTGNTKDAIKYYESALELDAVYASGRSIARQTIYDRLATLRRRR